MTRKDSEWEIYRSAARMLAAGEDIYYDGTLYLYPPFPAVAAQPFVRLTPVANRLAFYLLNVVALIALVRWSWRLAGGPALREAAPREHLAAAVGVVCGLTFFLNCLGHQQVDIVIAALVVGGCVALTAGQDIRAGILIGTGAAMKCTPLLFAPYLVLRGRWRAAGVVVLVAAALNLVPDLVRPAPQGGTWAARWVKRTLIKDDAANAYPGVDGTAAVYNQSLSGLCYRWLVAERFGPAFDLDVRLRGDAPSPATVRAILYGGQALLGLTVLAVLWRRRPTGEGPVLSIRLALEFSMVLLLMLLFSPRSSKAHFCTLVLPAFVLARLALPGRDRLQGFLLATAILITLPFNKDLCGYKLYGTALWHGNVTAATLCLLAACGIALWRLPIEASAETQCGQRPAAAVCTSHGLS